MTTYNSLTQTQLRRNAESAASWSYCESHRKRMTQLLVDGHVAEHPQLCVLGAGNCNDLDLQRLAAVFQTIELFDIDSAALTQAIATQNCEGIDAFVLHGDCDVTGVWERLGQIADSSDSDTSRADTDTIDQLVTQSQAWAGLSGIGQYGTVISACLLSQLVDGVIKSLGESHPRCLEVIATIRQRHLRLLYDLTAPGGHAILATDFVSSDTAPTLPMLSGKALASTLLHMISQHNFFTGINPFRLQSLLAEDPYFADKVRGVRCEQPWLWNFGPRHYAVTAICFQR